MSSKQLTDFWQVIAKRKSVRNYDSTKPVSESDVAKIIEAARQAPSAGGIYPVEFIVVKDIGLKNKLAECANRSEQVRQSPVVIVIVSDVEKTAAKYGERGRGLYAIQDAAAAAENLILGATALGLGTVWMGGFNEAAVSKLLQLKKSQRPLVIVPVGYELK